jgi:hypothetical protein
MAGWRRHWRGRSNPQFARGRGESLRVAEFLACVTQLLKQLDPPEEVVGMKVLQIGELQDDGIAALSTHAEFQMGSHLGEHGIEIIPVNQRGPAIRHGLTDFHELAIPATRKIAENCNAERGFRPGLCFNLLTACGHVEMNLTKRVTIRHGDAPTSAI